MISVIPFRARHLKEIKPDADEQMMRLALMAQETGPAYSAFLFGAPIGAGGVSIQRPGIGEAWTVFHPAIKAFPLFLHRECKTRFEKVMKTLDACYAVCDKNDRWIVKLGFTFIPWREVGELRPEFRLNDIDDGKWLYVRRG